MKRPMKTAALILTIAGFTASHAFAAAENLAPADRAHLLHARGKAEMIRSMKDLPAAIVQACASASSSHDFHLANPDEKFQATDVITEQRLPGKRLIWAAHIPGYYLVHYESGGIAHMFHLLLVAESPSGARVVWSAGSYGPVEDYDAFLSALDTKKIIGMANFPH
jgi:hypothetical protein